MSFVSPTSSSKWALFIPWQDDDFDQDEGAARNRRAENMRQIQQWANDRQPIKQIADIFCDGTQTAYTINVPSGHTDIYYKCSLNINTASATNILMTFNGDTTAGDYFTDVLFLIYASGAVGRSSVNNLAGIAFSQVDSATTTGPGVSSGTISNYTSTSPKTVSISSSRISTVTAQYWGGGLWAPATNAPITTVTITSPVLILANSRIQMWTEW